jgi:hypothetical protein
MEVPVKSHEIHDREGRFGGAAGALLFLMALASLASLAACGSSSDEPPAALNPGPPIRKAFILSLQTAASEIGRYQMMNGEVPQGEGVEVLYKARLMSVPQTDPWDDPVRYHGEGSTYTLSSAGPDRRWGTPDDIVIENGQLVAR